MNHREYYSSMKPSIIWKGKGLGDGLRSKAINDHTVKRKDVH